MAVSDLNHDLPKTPRARMRALNAAQDARVKVDQLMIDWESKKIGEKQLLKELAKYAGAIALGALLLRALSAAE
jgi:hypothetical protein